MWPLSTEADVTEKFFKQALDQIISYLRDSNDREKKVLDFHHPRVLKEKIPNFEMVDIEGFIGVGDKIALVTL